MPKDKSNVVLFSNVSGTDIHDNEVYMPLSILSIGTILTAHGHRVTLLDAQVDDRWQSRLRERLADADLFGVSSLTGPSIRAVLEAIAIARDVKPSVPIVWGGYHATQAYDSILDEGLADFVVRGPGENAALALADAVAASTLGQRHVVDSIPNLVFRREGRIVINRAEPLGDINDLPPMNYDLIEVPQYFGADRRSIEYISSYGCPYECTFCCEPAHTHRRWKGLAPERVVDEIVGLFHRYTPDVIGFQDPNFSTDTRRVIAIVEEMKRRGVRVPISADMRARDVVRLSQSMDLADFRRVGFVNVFMGLESGSDRMLIRLKKASTAAHARDAAHLLDAAGVVFCASFIHDLPEETDEDSDDTLRLVEDLARLPTCRQLHHFYIPFPSTELGESVLGLKPRRRMTQREWSDTSTYSFRSEYGRPDFRRRVLHQLIKLQRAYPSAIHPSTLPVLRFGQLEAQPTNAPSFWGHEYDGKQPNP